MKPEPIRLEDLGLTLSRVLGREFKPTSVQDVRSVVFAGDPDGTMFLIGMIFTPKVPPAWQLNFARFVKVYGGPRDDYRIAHGLADTVYRVFELTERVLKNAAEADNPANARALLSPNDDGAHLIAAYVILNYQDLPPGEQWNQLRESAADLYEQAGFTL
jgi:hypothetical protein